VLNKKNIVAKINNNMQLSKKSSHYSPFIDSSHNVTTKCKVNIDQHERDGIPDDDYNHPRIAVSPDGKVVYAGSCQHIGVFSIDNGTLITWLDEKDDSDDTSSRKCHTGWIENILLTSSGSHLVSWGVKDDLLIVWDNFKLISTFSRNELGKVLGFVHENILVCCEGVSGKVSLVRINDDPCIYHQISIAQSIMPQLGWQYGCGEDVGVVSLESSNSSNSSTADYDDFSNIHFIALKYDESQNFELIIINVITSSIVHSVKTTGEYHEIFPFKNDSNSGFVVKKRELRTQSVTATTSTTMQQQPKRDLGEDVVQVWNIGSSNLELRGQIEIGPIGERVELGAWGITMLTYEDNHPDCVSTITTLNGSL
jgi:hypothetical protein